MNIAVIVPQERYPVRQQFRSKPAFPTPGNPISFRQMAQHSVQYDHFSCVSGIGHFVQTQQRPLNSIDVKIGPGRNRHVGIFDVGCKRPFTADYYKQPKPRAHSVYS